MDPSAAAMNAPLTDEPGRIAQPAAIGIRSPANSAPTPCVVQRPQPTLGPMKLTATPRRPNQTRQSVRFPRPLT
jgi:hypothetical protein